MKFTKMQGAGNDFILVATSDVKRDWSALAVKMCDRHFGIGADSLLLVMPSTSADFKMRTFDTDGTEAETCGNGIRCVAKYVFEEGLISPQTDQVLVETIAGISQVKLNKQRSRIVNLQAGMGKPAFAADKIPVILKNKDKIVDIKSMLGYSVKVDGMELLLNLVSMGNPHAVYFTSQPVSDFPLTQQGPKVEHLSIFPKRTNFEVARVLSRKKIEVRVWERGVGETLACGSGACAVTVAAKLYGYTDNKVDIKLPGGTLQLEWDGTGDVLMSGPAERVFTGEWPE